MLNQNKEVHDDRLDKKIVMNNILPKILKDYGLVEFYEVNNKYYPIDIYALLKNNIHPIPIQVKNKQKYSIYQYKTLDIDATAYEDLKNYGILIVFYPVDKKILYFSSKQLQRAYKGIVKKDVKSYSEKNNLWYIEKNKELASINIEDGTIYDYNYFNIN